MGELDTDTAYRDAGLGGTLRRGERPAVLVIDLQNGFTQAGMPLAGELSRELAATRRLLDCARSHGAPVCFTAICFSDDLADAGIWLQKIPSLRTLTRGSGAAEIDVRLARREDETIVIKQAPSAWHGDGFREWLTAERVDCVLLCGATTSGCVRATAVDLLQASVPTLVVRDCVGDRAAAPHDASLIDLDAKYADVIGLDEALRYLEACYVVKAATP